VVRGVGRYDEEPKPQRLREGGRGTLGHHENVRPQTSQYFSDLGRGQRRVDHRNGMGRGGCGDDELREAAVVRHRGGQQSSAWLQTEFVLATPGCCEKG
jgi:hypothetical protein